ncbi:putative thiamine transporter SLC35F3 [Paramacrobiotus metropolitanus]|uniref:putative thiamine transporter SLC35F3 n=1 Tax=Paramacrobiotus metropolitanus TaxID=2943436 RepID=UPI00244629BE|nr:putative thiamine transporter SLC35F3 [Paramacrobiotus metropolitanus]XP_055337693.1 putative thiamine transporter SLC35F3 [Paramacrobiotus metropolitanus]
MAGESGQPALAEVDVVLGQDDQSDNKKTHVVVSTLSVEYERDFSESNDPQISSVTIESQVTVDGPVAEETDWQRFGISLVILLFCASTAVGDQQLSKEVNGSTFDAPFFFLWCSNIVRMLTFPALVCIRMIYEYTCGHAGLIHKIWICGKAHRSIVISGENKRISAKGLWVEAKSLMGPKGFQPLNCVIYLVPFALSIIAINGLFYWAVTYASVSECVTIGSQFIIIVHIISWVFLKEKFLIFKLLGIIVCIAGVVLTAYASGEELVSSSDSWIAAALMTGSSVSLAVTSVLFKKHFGTPTISQIALYQSLTSTVMVLISWPLFLALKLTGNEIWDFQTAPWLIIVAQGAIGAVGALAYYVAISFASPVFITMSRPLQIVINNGIDIGARGDSFSLLNGIAAALVIAGFLMLVIPNNFVDFEIKARITRLWWNGESSSGIKDNISISSNRIEMSKY